MARAIRGAENRSKRLAPLCLDPDPKGDIRCAGALLEAREPVVPWRSGGQFGSGRWCCSVDRLVTGEGKRAGVLCEPIMVGAEA